MLTPHHLQHLVPTGATLDVVPNAHSETIILTEPHKHGGSKSHFSPMWRQGDNSSLTPSVDIYSPLQSPVLWVNTFPHITSQRATARTFSWQWWCGTWLDQGQQPLEQYSCSEMMLRGMLHQEAPVLMNPHSNNTTALDHSPQQLILLQASRWLLMKLEGSITYLRPDTKKAKLYKGSSRDGKSVNQSTSTVSVNPSTQYRMWIFWQTELIVMRYHCRCQTC